MPEKYSLGPAARATKERLHAGTYTPGPKPTIIGNVIPESMDREMYELGAIIGSDAVQDLKDGPIRYIASPSHGFITERGYSSQPDSIKRFDGLLKAMQNTAGYFVHYHYQVPRVYQPAYDRLDYLVARAHEARPTAGRGRYELGARGYLQSGFNTAIAHSLGAQIGMEALLIAETGQRPSDETFRGLASRSIHKLISPIALDNILRINPYERAMTVGFYAPADEPVVQDNFIYNPNLLRISPSLDDPRAYVEFITPPSEFIDPVSAQKIGKIATERNTITCLGTVKFPDSEVATKTIWDWTTEAMLATKLPH